jgi:hypothetical protein
LAVVLLISIVNREKVNSVIVANEDAVQKESKMT